MCRRTVHPQRDPLNPHPFVEPSSAQLWQAAGLAPDRLQQILDQFDRDSSRWTAKQYRRKVIRHTLTPQLTEEEATRLLRISAIQAVYNAKAYCRGFDELTGSQQMAVSQLVFQMGTNLEEFVEFLGALNDENGARELPQLDGYIETDAEHWQTVQRTLIDSQWARRYTSPRRNRHRHVRSGLQPGARRSGTASGGGPSSPGRVSAQKPVHRHPSGRELQQTFREDARQKVVHPQAKRKLT